MSLDDIPIVDKDRDAAWASFIRRQDVTAFFQQQEEAFRFPLERSWYELWCQAWERGWQAGHSTRVRGE